MSIKEELEKCKDWVTGVRKFFQPEKLLERNTFVALVVLLSVFSAFALGRLSAMEENRTPAKITFPEERTTAATVISKTVPAQPVRVPVPIPQPQTMEEGGGEYVGSRNGTKYHLPWCSGAKRISEKNKIRFASKEEAENAGYTPAANCKGI